jgi:hypothetical protein
MTFKPYLLWDGKVENYFPWKRIIMNELEKFHCENEEQKLFYVKKNIVGRMKSQIKDYLLDCFNIGELFECLDAQNSCIYEAVLNLKEDLNKLPSLPEGEAQENKNIQKIIRFIRILRKNKMNLPFNFASDCANKLSKENCMRIIEMQNKNSDLDDIESFSKLLYNIQAVNVQMMATSERLSPVVTTREKTLVAPKKKIIKSKLSRIRKRFYLTRDENTAVIYQREVDRYVRNFKMTPHEQNGWKKKIEQTYNDVKPLVDKEENPQDDENDENLPQEILDIPDSCEEKAVREDFAEKNVVENPKDDENVNPMDDAVVKEDSDENIMDPPDVFSNNPHIEDEDDEFTLPNVPDEVPGELDDKDEILHVRLKELKKFRKKHFNEKKKEKVALIVAPFMPTQSAGAKDIPFCPANLKPDTGHSLGNTSREAHVTCHVEEPGNKGPYEETSTKFVHSCDLKPCGQKSPQSDFNEELKDNPNENGPQPMLFLWTILMMILIDSIQKMNKRMDLPPARCSCHYSKETARVLAVTKLTMITSGLKAGMLEIQRRTVKWIKQRKEEILNWTIQFLEAIK